MKRMKKEEHVKVTKKTQVKERRREEDKKIWRFKLGFLVFFETKVEEEEDMELFKEKRKPKLRKKEKKKWSYSKKTQVLNLSRKCIRPSICKG